jgi:hypothetical protein
VASVSAKVTDVNGAPVPNVFVTFTESGPGRFINPNNGADSTVVATNASGIATAELTSQSGENGTTNITASIANQGNECAAVAGKTASGATATGATAGNCTDTAAVTFGTPSPSPSSSAGTCPSPQTNLPVRVNTPTINATGLASVTITGAPSNATIEVQGYSQNHYLTANFNNDPTPIDRRVTAGSDGSVTVNDLRPASNTRLRARVFGCAWGQNALGSVINVRTQLTLVATRTAVRTVVISGKSIPARPGGLIVGIYRDGRLIGQARASQTSGNYSVTLRFPASDQGRRINLTARTGQDAQNAPGISNVRSLLIR